MESTVGLSTCNICHGAGRYKDDLGLFITCKCVAEKENAKAINKSIKEPVIKVIKAVKDQLVGEGVIPEHRIDDEWDDAILLDNVDKMTGKANGKVGFTVDDVKLAGYIKTLSGILATLRMGEKVKSSFLIGASNGLGKTTFANTAIKLCRQNGWKVVPYTSLLEIAESKKNVTKKYKIGDFLTETEKPEDGEEETVEESKWQYKDYVNAELLITYLSDVEVDTASIEMFTLQALLRERSNKGKATIVFMETGLQWYWSNESIKKYVLNEILAPMGMRKLDRLEYSSVYLV